MIEHSSIKLSKEIIALSNSTTWESAMKEWVLSEVYSDRIFAAIKRISKDNAKSWNIEAIEYMNERGWLTEWEYGFCINTMKKRVLSERQLKSRVDINQKLLRKPKNQLSHRGTSD
ncbi:conserved hypothetical protein [Candidatus Cloacimonas acidaminovorans str. Evry]|jgi:hypothetical protein|uniref:Uncharacterized protein n=2 Tax=Candidatus Cloacimonas TaxID=456826 RepID=B0VF75_CLOAI|nr:conserved hypothetical protein [Candidatus Cloacimonas acidaminovorans str. Evry]